MIRDETGIMDPGDTLAAPTGTDAVAATAAPGPAAPTTPLAAPERIDGLRRAWPRSLTRPDPPAGAAPAPVPPPAAMEAPGDTPPDEPAGTDEGAAIGSPFADVACARVLTSPDGCVSATMTVPDWLTGPTPGPRLGMTAVAALAEIALDAAAGTGLCPGELTVATTLQLRALGPAAGWPDPAGPAGGPRPVFAPGTGRARERQRPIRLRAEARLDDADAGEPGVPVRRATATVRTSDGRPLANASAICAVIRPARAADTDGAAATPVAVPVPPPASHTPGGLISHEPVPHPLLAALDADLARDGDQVTLRLRPPAWLANRLGRAHAAACCALADAAITTALARRLPTGSAVHTLSLDLTVLRSISLESEVVTVATVRHVGRRLAVVEAELSQDGAPPSVVARATLARTTHHQPHR
jgi:uncharacterized protein (TIGR00369 family)